MIIHAWRCDFVQLLSCFIRKFGISFTHFFAWPCMSQDHEDIVSASSFSVAFVSGNFSVAPEEILDSNILL